MRIYFDVCCLSRLTDDHSQPGVRAEAEAIEHIMRMVSQGKATWVASTVLSVEVGRNPSHERRRDAEALLLLANEVIAPGLTEALRARAIEERGFGTFDALHLAMADKLGADVFLTTDDNLLRHARRSFGWLRIWVDNPVSWYQEQHS